MKYLLISVLFGLFVNCSGKGHQTNPVSNINTPIFPVDTSVTCTLGVCTIHTWYYYGITDTGINYIISIPKPDSQLATGKLIEYIEIRFPENIIPDTLWDFAVADSVYTTKYFLNYKFSIPIKPDHKFRIGFWIKRK